MIDPLIKAAILGVVEGVTEFIPVSSTGHLIVVGHWLGETSERAKTFEIFIQLGAILAIVWLYRVRLTTAAVEAWKGGPGRRLLVNLVLGFVPVAIVGLLVHDWIKERLFTPSVVAAALIVGGIVILLIERLQAQGAHRQRQRCAAGNRAGRRVGADPVARAGHIPVGRHDHGRLRPRPVAHRRHRVFLLSFDPGHVRRDALRPPVELAQPRGIRRSRASRSVSSPHSSRRSSWFGCSSASCPEAASRRSRGTESCSARCCFCCFGESGRGRDTPLRPRRLDDGRVACDGARRRGGRHCGRCRRTVGRTRVERKDLELTPRGTMAQRSPPAVELPPGSSC